MWDLSFLTRDWTHTPCIGKWSFNHWTTREILRLSSCWASLCPNAFKSHRPSGRTQVAFYCVWGIWPLLGFAGKGSRYTWLFQGSKLTWEGRCKFSWAVIVLEVEGISAPCSSGAFCLQLSAHSCGPWLRSIGAEWRLDFNTYTLWPLLLIFIIILSWEFQEWEQVVDPIRTFQPNIVPKREGTWDLMEPCILLTQETPEQL